MASLERTIKRGMLFRSMNKQQRRIWRAYHGKKHKIKEYDDLKEKAKA